jgi:hypothetical protein
MSVPEREPRVTSNARLGFFTVNLTETELAHQAQAADARGIS